MDGQFSILPENYPVPGQSKSGIYHYMKNVAAQADCCKTPLRAKIGR